MIRIKNFRLSCSILFCNLLLITTVSGHFQYCPFQKKNILPVPQQNYGDICDPSQKICNPFNVYYSYDGSCNNLQFTHWGQSGYPFVRLLPANYSDGISKLRTSVDGSPLPLASALRNCLLPNANTQSNKLNVMFTGFGQFVDHDVTHQKQINSPDKCCLNGKPAPFQNPNVCIPAIFTPNDPFYSKFRVTCLSLKRAVNTQMLHCPIKPILQINHETAFIDLSILYGPTAAKALKLRTLSKGLLKVTNDATTSFQEFPPISSGFVNCPAGGVFPAPGNPCFVAGDPRINQNPELLVTETIFLRLHNYLVRKLNFLNPQWNDERLYQQARKINIAIYQHILSAEYIPVLIGPTTASLYKLYPLGTCYAKGYDPSLNAQTLVSYTAGSGRAGHSTVSGKVKYKGPNGLLQEYKLRNKYFNQQFLFGANMFQNIIQAYSNQECGKQDQYFTEEVNNWLFDSVGAPYGQDLSTIDILRGRDYGLSSYNSYRVACGLCKLKTFEDLTTEIKNPADVFKLKLLYKDVNDIDLYVGGLLEKPLPESTVGPTFACITAESFYRWKFGDRLWYEFSQSGFTPAQLSAIKTATFAEILCITNPTLAAVAKYSFLVPSAQNPLVPCCLISKMNLAPWKSFN